MDICESSLIIGSDQVQVGRATCIKPEFLNKEPLDFFVLHKGMCTYYVTSVTILIWFSFNFYRCHNPPTRFMWWSSFSQIIDHGTDQCGFWPMKALVWALQSMLKALQAIGLSGLATAITRWDPKASAVWSASASFRPGHCRNLLIIAKHNRSQTIQTWVGRQDYHNIATTTGCGLGQHNAIFLIAPWQCDAKCHHKSFWAVDIPASYVMSSYF